MMREETVMTRSARHGNPHPSLFATQAPRESPAALRAGKHALSCPCWGILAAQAWEEKANTRANGKGIAQMNADGLPQACGPRNDEVERGRHDGTPDSRGATVFKSKFFLQTGEISVKGERSFPAKAVPICK
jgi:hypothetical protein